MVTWTVNELSISRQYVDLERFSAELLELVKAAMYIRNNGHLIDCTVQLHCWPITDGKTVRDAVAALPADARKIVFGWLTKGPFATSDQQGPVMMSAPEVPVIAYHDSRDVTCLGLGVVARRLWRGEDAGAFSFEGNPAFEKPHVQLAALRDGVPEPELVNVPNQWDVAAIRGLCAALARPRNWDAMVDEAIERFPNLYIPRDQIIRNMRCLPYNRSVNDAIIEILKFLNDLSLARIKHGDGSREVNDWINTYVCGHRSRFSGQEVGDGNRDRFTFNDPETGADILCPNHGKVRLEVNYRIHYEWPMPAGRSRLKVLYIGEHL
ncbi:hypothetical protein [Novispirillum itersonii]|uniref:hypothetical protein n=1 Tax=Novispirillum itersonii TaxID=189 RepID=UPI000367C4AC|nr:hypothetical protein [Novispirillum itersonii]